MSVSIVRVPPAPDGSKQGIDDYLTRGGRLEDLEVLPFEGGWLPPKDWPTLADQALQGLAGDVVKTILPNTESDPTAILGLFLSAYGNIIGRGAHFVVEGDTHYCKLWPVLVGESALARKGTAQGRVDKVLRQIDEGWILNCRAQGLSSGEGLIYHVRDRKTKTNKEGEEMVVDDGVIDKRLLVTEPEFASPLTVMQREGSTLSVAVRMAWDDQVMQTMSKNSPEKATGSHITICSHTNREELLKHLTSAKLGGGVGNRFFFLLVRRSKKLPHGGAEDVLSDDLVRRLREAIAFGKNHRHIGLSEKFEEEYNGQSASKLWEVVYDSFSEGAAAGLFGVVTSRGEAQVRRFATTYAALDCSPEVKIRHLLAGLALWEYSKQSSYLIFQGKTGDEIADEILQALQAAGEGGMSRNELLNHFNRNVRANRIRAALTQLHRDGWARYEVNRSSGPGAPEERWYACLPE
jgi:hypothetical protein